MDITVRLAIPEDTDYVVGLNKKFNHYLYSLGETDNTLIKAVSDICGDMGGNELV